MRAGVALDTARSAVSVDTDVLLGDLASVRETDEPSRPDSVPRRTPLNTHAANTHLSSSVETRSPPDAFSAQSPHLSASSSLATELAPRSSAYTQSQSVRSSSPGADERRISVLNTSTQLTQSPDASLNFTYNQSTSLPSAQNRADLDSTFSQHPPPQSPSSSSPQYLSPAGDMVSSRAVSGKGQFHADELLHRQLGRSQVTARSVTSTDCAPVDYDHDDVLADNLERYGSSGFETSMSDKRQLSEDTSPSASRDHDSLRNLLSGLEASALKNRHRLRCPRARRNGSSGFETPVLEQRRLSETDDTLCSVTSRSECSLDAAMILRDAADDVVDTSPMDSGTTSRTLASVDTNVLLQRTEDVVMAMEAARTNHSNHTSSRDPFPPARNVADFSYEDVDKNPYAGEVANHWDADYETETAYVGKPGIAPHRSVSRKPPPANGKSHVSLSASNGQRRAKDAWGSLPNHDIPDDVATSGKKNHRHLKTVQLSEKRSTAFDLDDVSELAGGPYTSLRSEFDPRRYGTHPRPRSGTRTYHGQDSDRSLASSASLGEKIVVRSRQNQRPLGGKSQRNSGSAQKKTTSKQQQQRDRDSSPSGLVLEGCRVQLRPASAVSRLSCHDPRPSTATTKRAVNSSVTAVESRTPGRSDDRRSVEVSCTEMRRNGWTDDMSSLNDSHSEPLSAPLNQQVYLRRFFQWKILLQSSGVLV